MIYKTMDEKQQEQAEELHQMALCMQQEGLSMRGFRRWLQLPASGVARKKQLQELCHTYPHCGVFAHHWCLLCATSQTLAQMSLALQLLRQAKPSWSKDSLASLYMRREVLACRKHKTLHKKLEQAQSLMDASEKVAWLTPLAARHIGIARVQYVTAVAYWQDARPEEALRFLLRAVHLNPYWDHLWWLLAWIALDAGHLEQAYSAFSQLHSLHTSIETQVLTPIQQHLASFGAFVHVFEQVSCRHWVGDQHAVARLLKEAKALPVSPWLEARWQDIVKQEDLSLIS
ncbi:MAG: hypothetical protein AAGJ35_13315 [Myxococcota bacterium]